MIFLNGFSLFCYSIMFLPFCEVGGVLSGYALYAEKTGISLDEALKIFYNSEVYRLISVGVSDMHCMSDDYLVQELIEENN